MVKESGLDASYLKAGVTNFVVVYFPDKRDYLINSLKNKIDIFLKYAKDEREKIRQQQKEQENKKYLEFDRDSFEKEKIDIYDQVMLNWDVFIKYVWDNIK